MLRSVNPQCPGIGNPLVACSAIVMGVIDHWIMDNHSRGRDSASFAIRICP